MREARTRVIGLLVGDLVRERFAAVKYGAFFEALGRRVELVAVCDVTLRGVDRLLAAAVTADFRPGVWREKFYQSAWAFRRRSRRAAARVRGLAAQADVTLQLGALFHAGGRGGALPNVVYTDYTGCLAARRPDAGRAPFTPAQRLRWLDGERGALQAAAHVCTRSRLVRASVCTDYAVAPGCVTSIGGGLNMASLPELRGPPLPPRAPTALFIGKDFYRKGGDLLLRAFALVREKQPEARLVCLTSGAPPPDLPREGVAFVAPTWDRAAIDALYRRADVFVLPSRLETWGDVLLEAGAYGLPCLGVTGQPMEEIIVPGETGLLAPPEDVPALAAALGRLLGDGALRSRLGLAARQRVAAEYTWDRVVERLDPILAAAARNNVDGSRARLL